MPKVSVIVPIYKVELYIERCLHTLFNQTLDDIEYIFIDDCSPDASMMIIHKISQLYPIRKKQIRILTHNENCGLAAARALGLRVAKGEYVISCDPDDYVEPSMYEKMYNRAVQNDADIVVCFYWRESVERKTLIVNSYDETPQRCLKNMYKKGRVYPHLWDKLVRRTIITEHNIFPYTGINYGDDLNCTVRILYYSKSICVVKEPLYHYCRRMDSLSNIMLGNEDDLKKRMYNVELICNFLQQVSGNEYDSFCSHMKFSLKRECQHLIYDDEHTWFNLYRECYKHIFSYTIIPFKSRLVIWLAMQNFSLYKMMKRIFFDI